MAAPQQRCASAIHRYRALGVGVVVRGECSACWRATCCDSFSYCQPSLPPFRNNVISVLGARTALHSAARLAVGRRFEVVNRWLRVAMGTEREMQKVKSAFEK